MKTTLDDVLKKHNMTRAQLSDIIKASVEKVGGALTDTVTGCGVPDDMIPFMLGEVIVRVTGIAYTSLQAIYGLPFEDYVKAIRSAADQYTVTPEDYKEAVKTAVSQLNEDGPDSTTFPYKKGNA